MRKNFGAQTIPSALLTLLCQIPSFFTPFRSRQIQRPSPLKSDPDLYSAVLCVLQIGRVRANADFKKARTQSEGYRLRDINF